MSENVRLISPSEIQPNKENPRLIFRRDELEALERSISKQGILVPLTVFDNGEHFTILDGERRWRCAFKLGLSQVPVIIQPKPNRLTNIMMMFAIHKARSDWDPLPTAMKLAELEAELERRHGSPPTEAALAAAASLSRGEVRRYRRILNLPDRYKSELMAELDKPRHEQVLTVDHILETTKGVDALLKREIITESEADGLSDAIVLKFKQKTEKSTVGPRALPKIARAVERGDVRVERVRAVIRQLTDDVGYSCDDAFTDAAAEAESERSLEILIDRFERQITDHIESDFRISRALTVRIQTLLQKLLEADRYD